MGGFDPPPLTANLSLLKHNAELSGDLEMKAKPQCKGRPAAIGRELQRLVMSHCGMPLIMIRKVPLVWLVILP